jgi:hypothetical protein
LKLNLTKLNQTQPEAVIIKNTFCTLANCLAKQVQPAVGFAELDLDGLASHHAKGWAVFSLE